MTLIDNDKFIFQLGKLFKDSRLGGPKSVSITMKRYDGKTKPTPKDPVKAHAQPTGEGTVLFRAKLGNKKISTVVQSKEVNKFSQAYASVLSENMDNLEKRTKNAEGTTVIQKKKPAARPAKAAVRKSKVKK